MPGFLFDVGTRFDEAGVEAFVAKVKQAMAQVASQGGTGAPSRLEDIRSGAGTGLAALREGGADSLALNRARRDLTQSLRTTATALVEEISSAKHLSTAQRRAADDLIRLSKEAVSPRGQTSIPVTSLAEAGAFLAQRREEVFKRLTPADVAYSGVPTELRAAGAEKAQMARLGLDEIAGEAADARKLRILAAQRTVTEGQRVARAQQALSAESEESAAIVQRMVAERRLNRELNARVANEIRSRAAAGEADFQGTLFQRLQSGAASRTGQTPRLPAEFATLSQFLTSKAITTAGFAVAGVGLYGGIQSIKSAIEESTKLQTALKSLESQFVATDQAGDFPQYRQAILDAARETGTLGSEVASLAPLFVAAFGGGTKGAEELRNAVIGIKAGAFTKEDAANVSNALHSTYGVAVAEITDQGLHLRDVFGATSDEILKATANLAPVAKETGLTFKETSTLIAAATQAAGAPATSIAEALNRILPQIQENAAQILNVYNSVPSLRSKLPQVGAELGQGQTGAVLLGLVRDYNQLGDAQQKQIITALGGRREAQALIPLLNQSSVAIKELDDNTSHAGRTQESFNAVMSSIGEQFNQLSELFRQIGQDLLRAGLAGALHDVAVVGGGLLSILGGIVSVLGDLNDLTHGWGGRIIGVVVAMRILGPLLKSALASGLVSSLATGIGPGLARVLVGSGRGAAAVGTPGLLPGSAGYVLPTAAAATSAGGLRGVLGGASIGGVLGGPIGIIGASVVTGILAEHRADAQSKAAALRKKLDAADLETLREGARQHDGILSDTITKLFGGEPAADIYAKKIRTKQSKPLVAEIEALKAGHHALTEGEAYDLNKKATGPEAYAVGEVIKAEKKGGPTNYDKLIADLNAGKEGADKAAEALLNAYKKRPGFAAIFEKDHADLASQLAAAQQKEDVDSGQALVNVQTLVQEYEAGDRSLGSTLAALQAQIDLYASIPNPDEKLRALIAAASKAKTELDSKSRREAADLRLELGDTGGTAGPEAKIAEYTRLLEDPVFRNSSEGLKTARDLAKAEQDLLKKTADLAANGEDKARILRDGIPRSQGEKLAFAAQLIRLAPQIDQFSTNFLSGIRRFAAQFNQNLIALVASGKTIREATIILLDEEISKLEAAVASTAPPPGSPRSRLAYGFSGKARAHAKSEEELAAARAARANVPGDLSDFTIDPNITSEGAAEVAAQKPSDLAAAHRELAKALAHGDPVLEAQNELGAANEELAGAVPGSAEAIRAQARVIETGDSLAKAYDDITKARLELAKAQVGDNAVEQARIGQQQAAAAAAAAHGEAEQLRAQAQQIEADRTLQKAISDVFNSQTELAIAIAEAAGDTVRAAELGAQEAMDKLNQALSRQEGPEVTNRLQADLVRAQAHVRDAKVAEQERKINFALEIGRITASEAVAQLQGLLQLVAGNEQATDEILLKIHQLMKEASRDLAFNIPSEIRLPTLYEVRRLRQDPGGGAVDNRQINVQYNVLGPQDHQRALNELVGVISGQPRVGVQPRLYP